MIPANQTANFTALIPARLASTRLPSKALADIAGVPMVVRVAQQALKSGASRVFVATDSHEVIRACSQFSIESLLTRADHISGTDRLAEACTLLALNDDELVINVQGDEPLMDPLLIAATAQLLASRPDCAMSTAACPIDTAEAFENPNVVKVVLDGRQTALYFSRSPIPNARDCAAEARWAPESLLPKPLRHIGIYGMRAGFLKSFPYLSPAPLEQLESLEQLRAMWHGYKIAVHVTSATPGTGVDTQQDLDRVRELFGRSLE